MPTYGINGTTLNLEHLQLKFKNASAWNETDVLLAGEVGVELDTGKAKIGDGTKTWSQLGYSADPTLAGIISGLTERVDTAETSLSGLAGRMDTAEGNITSQGTRLTTAEDNITSQGTRLTTAEGDIDALEAKDVTHEGRMTTIEAKDTAQDGRLDALEGITTISANSFSE